MKTVEYLGKTLTTSLYRELTDDEYNSIINDYYAKPDINEVKEQFIKVCEGGSKTDAIWRKYFKDIASDVHVQGEKWSINEVLASREVLGAVMGRADAHPKVFAKANTLCKKFEDAVRIGAKGIVRKPTQFPIKAAREIIGKYCTNGNYYDYSCGWGMRLLVSLSYGVNYYGTDPNHILVGRLNEMVGDFRSAMISNSTVDIRCAGSEVYVPEWSNKMSLCFSSPPYFDLEDYVHGEQSIKKNANYKDWLRNYVCPTMKNCKDYLIEGGTLAYNIKNMKKYKMADDFHSILQWYGFELVDMLDVKNGTRLYGSVSEEASTQHIVDTNEHIFVYKSV